MSEILDSLKTRVTELGSHERLTSDQIDDLNEVAWELRHAEPKLAAQGSADAWRSAVQISYSRGIAYALRGIGNGQRSIDQYAESVQTLEQSRAMFVALPLPDEAGLASVINVLGSSQRYLGHSNRALESHHTALKSFENAGESSKVALAYNNLGGIHSDLGDYLPALEYLYQGLQISSEFCSPMDQALLHCTLGDILLRVGDSDHSLTSLRRAIDLFREYGDRRNEGLALINIGAAYKSVKKHERALNCYIQGLEIAREVGSLETQTEAHLCMGRIFGDLGNHQEAHDHLSEALQLSTNICSPYNECQALLHLGCFYNFCGDIAKSVEVLESALALSSQHEFREIGFEANHALSSAYEKSDKSTAALSHYRAFHEGREVVFGSIVSRKLEKLVSLNVAKQSPGMLQELRRPSPPLYIERRQSALSPHNLRQGSEFIDNILEAKIKITELSQLTSLNYAHFIRTFKHSTGKTPHQFLIEKRIDRAKLLLKTTGSSLADVALQCGFSSQSHLTAQFRLVTGTSPRQFRLFS